MFYSKIQSRLDGLEDTEVFRIKNEALAFLRDFDFDWCRCADKLEISILLLFEIRDRFFLEFEELRIRFIAKCETTVVGAATGAIDLENDGEHRRVQHCKWILERQSPGWNKTQRITVKDERRTAIDVTPKVQELLEEHDRKIESLRVRGLPRESIETSKV
jgi:hypothetical protein